MLKLTFGDEIDLNMNLRIKSPSTISKVPVGGFVSIHHELGLMFGPQRAVVSASWMPTDVMEPATLSKVVYATRGSILGLSDIGALGVDFF